MHSGYGSISEAHQVLIEAMPPNTPPPSSALIYRSARRGEIRTLHIGSTRTLFNLEDVHNLVSIRRGGAA